MRPGEAFTLQAHTHTAKRVVVCPGFIERLHLALFFQSSRRHHTYPSSTVLYGASGSNALNSTRSWGEISELIQGNINADIFK